MTEHTLELAESEESHSGGNTCHRTGRGARNIRKMESTAIGRTESTDDQEDRKM